MTDEHQHEPLIKAAAHRHVPFLELLEIRPVAAEKGRATFEMKIDQRHLRTLGILHGGVTATLLDTAMGYAAGTQSPPGHFVVTVQLNVNFIRPAWDGEALVATGEVKHTGQQTAVAFGELRNSDGVLIATGTGTFMYIRQPDKAGATLPQRSDASSPDSQSGEVPSQP